jgi:hypothetical protein
MAGNLWPKQKSSGNHKEEEREETLASNGGKQFVISGRERIGKGTREKCRLGSGKR